LGVVRKKIQSDESLVICLVTVATHLLANTPLPVVCATVRLLLGKDDHSLSAEQWERRQKQENSTSRYLMALRPLHYLVNE
jgi:hypothetical protein